LVVFCSQFIRRLVPEIEIRKRRAGFSREIGLGDRGVVDWSGTLGARLPQLRHRSERPKIPATRQPYHAATGKLETNAAKLKARLKIVRRVTRQSIANVLADCRRRNLKVCGVGLVVGSQIDPGLIANPHIRAHALEGQLFRTALDDALRGHDIHTVIFVERDAYGEAAIKLRKSIGEVQRAIQNLGRSAERPWRAEQKFASLVAWIALNR
jgi:hypothetical protein